MIFGLAWLGLDYNEKRSDGDDGSCVFIVVLELRFETATEDSDGAKQSTTSVSECDERRSVRGDRRASTHPPSTVDNSSLARRRSRDNNIVEFLTGKNTLENFRNATFSSFRSNEKDTSGGCCSDDRWQHKEPFPEIAKSKTCVTSSVAHPRPLLALRCPLVATAEAQVTAGTPVTSQGPVVISGAPVVTAGTLKESSPNLDRVIVVDGGTVCDRIDRILLLQKNIRSSNV